jgi:hypothetical protein
MMRFLLRKVVATPGALQVFAATGQSPVELLHRHANGDWGDLDDEDKRENEFSLYHGFRIFSSYILSSGDKLWVITEADRSVTTLLLPDEY